jgi:hypothetical protein
MQHFCHFNKHVLNPIKRSGYVNEGRRAMLKLKEQILDEVLLRRTKVCHKYYIIPVFIIEKLFVFFPLLSLSLSVSQSLTHAIYTFIHIYTDISSGRHKSSFTSSENPPRAFGRERRGLLSSPLHSIESSVQHICQSGNSPQQLRAYI